MKSVIDAITGILMIIAVGSSMGALYHMVKKETVIKVHRGLGRLEPFTRKLTKTTLPY